MSSSQVLHLIACPRNISTAFMYSFAQRSDTVVVDEPFYGFYLRWSGVAHPGRELILHSMPDNPKEIMAAINEFSKAPYLFIKNMAHHLDKLDWTFLLKHQVLFLIRNPRQLIASFAQVIEQPTMQDIGLQRQHEIFKWLEVHGNPPAVLDSGELLKNPSGVMRKVCETFQIPFDENMLSWEPGPRPEDGIWAPYWYANVHRSSGFNTQKTSNRPFPKYLKPLLDQVQPYYSFLFEQSIKA